MIESDGKEVNAAANIPDWTGWYRATIADVFDHLRRRASATIAVSWNDLVEPESEAWLATPSLRAQPGPVSFWPRSGAPSAANDTTTDRLPSASS
jgi:hypothetical protein